jgi:hypothetical protein
MLGYAFGVVLGGSSAFLGVPALLWLLGDAMRQGNLRGESMVLAMPLVGRVYEWILRLPEARVQLCFCIVQLVRASLNYVNWKGRRRGRQVPVDR